MTETMPEKRETAGGQPERPRGGQTYTPNVDIAETKDEILLFAEIPGARAENININYERGLLTLEARVEPRQKGGPAYLLQEYGVGDFHRSFQIGEGVDADKIHAEVANGMLTLHLPKAEAVKTRKIQVKTT